jgi:bifunctional DNA-binding transcriptional regulator/antitoxin component of YhaV-PrlF toxin-antitoxin module
MAMTITRRETVRLRTKNQLTLPEPITRALGAQPGDRFFISFEEPDRAILQRVPKSYAGALAGVWGTYEEAMADLRASRDEWDERERRQLGDWNGQIDGDR